jgi:hypothetical protein
MNQTPEMYIRIPQNDNKIKIKSCYNDIYIIYKMTKKHEILSVLRDLAIEEERSLEKLAPAERAGWADEEDALN